jgi:hypothetical protein
MCSSRAVLNCPTSARISSPRSFAPCRAQPEATQMKNRPGFLAGPVDISELPR